eukprot:TRINITY_DN103182_c0_g1_i1.p1 TRINITY_DN103182_c0_g1~~TRINITY_DN103182_c0_g1_i1.p1  ORF type:complete len:593 (+),score=60.89 TRINITY_DN103182_c0_g1_i1:77-1855(+)
MPSDSWLPPSLSSQSAGSLRSQARFNKRVLQSAQSRSNGSQSLPNSGPRPRPDEDEVDVLAKMDLEQVSKVVAAPPQLDEDETQSEQVLLDVSRQPVRQNVIQSIALNTVLLHVYNLNDTFVDTNRLLAFSNDRGALGGLFHVGVEVYGSEWAYGVCGISCSPPRAESAHVYECSVYMGNTNLSQGQFTLLLYELCRLWRGAEYDIVGHNCCSFAREFCERLGAGSTPPWVDRFARLLHAGREAGHHAIQVGAQAMQQAGQVAAYHGHKAGRVVHRAVTRDVPAMIEAARPHVQSAVSEAVQQGQAVGEAVGVQVQIAAKLAERQAVRLAEELPGHAAHLQEQAAIRAENTYRFLQPHLHRGMQSMAAGFMELGQHVAQFPGILFDEYDASFSSAESSPQHSLSPNRCAPKGFGLPEGAAAANICVQVPLVPCLPQGNGLRQQQHCCSLTQQMQAGVTGTAVWPQTQAAAYHPQAFHANQQLHCQARPLVPTASPVGMAASKTPRSCQQTLPQGTSQAPYQAQGCPVQTPRQHLPAQQAGVPSTNNPSLQPPPKMPSGVGPAQLQLPCPMHSCGAHPAQHIVQQWQPGRYLR